MKTNENKYDAAAMLFTRPNSLKLHVIFYQMVVMVAMHNILYISYLFFLKRKTLSAILSKGNYHLKIYIVTTTNDHTHTYIYEISQIIIIIIISTLSKKGGNKQYTLFWYENPSLRAY